MRQTPQDVSSFSSKQFSRPSDRDEACYSVLRNIQRTARHDRYWVLHAGWFTGHSVRMHKPRKESISQGKPPSSVRYLPADEVWEMPRSLPDTAPVPGIECSGPGTASRGCGVADGENPLSIRGVIQQRIIDRACDFAESDRQILSRKRISSEPFSTDLLPGSCIQWSGRHYTNIIVSQWRKSSMALSPWWGNKLL